MTIVNRYLTYAEAFERTVRDDQWTRIEPYFTEGAVYEGEPDAVGRDAVIRKLKGGLDGFDRTMDSRSLRFETPTVDGDTLSVRWSATYTKAGCPDLVLSGIEEATFEQDRIARLRDIFDPAAQKAMSEWMSAHGSK